MSVYYMTTGCMHVYNLQGSTPYPCYVRTWLHVSLRTHAASAQPVQAEGMRKLCVGGSSKGIASWSCCSTIINYIQFPTAEGSQMVQGLEARGSTRHLNIPQEARRDLVKIISEVSQFVIHTRQCVHMADDLHISGWCSC